MIARLLEKFLEFVLGPVQPAPAPEPPAPKVEPPPDPKEVAAEMRACAAWLHKQADRLDPLVIPEFGMPPIELLPPRWNSVLDECGESGGTVKRAGSGVRLETRPPASGRPTVSADDPDPEFEEVDEIADRLATKWGLKIDALPQGTEIGKDTIDNFRKAVEEVERKTKP